MKFIIPITVGAVIGYITNWFAIKMLFRPHYEEKFLGIHVPFTPGLIPKEKGRIAKSVGDTVGAYLLSPEIIMKSISNDENNDKVRTWVEHNINSLKESNKSIKDLVPNLDEEKYNNFLNAVSENITNLICSGIKNKGSKHKETELSEEEIYNKINELEYDQKTLEEIIPDNIVSDIKEYVERHDEDITNGLRSVFET